MKIAQVVCVYPPYAGGIGMSALKLQKTFSEKHSSAVFTISDKDKNKKENIVKLRPLLKLGHGAILPQLIWKLKKFDLIYFHYPFFGTSFIIYLFKLLNPKKRIIIHYHMDVKQKNILFKILSWPEKIIEKSLFKKSEKIISASLDYIKHSQIKHLYQLWPEKFIEIPFSINTTEFCPSTENKRNQILFVGGLDPAHYFKGVNILISALSLLDDKEIKLIIAGDGSLKKSLEALAEKLKIRDRVVFLGKIEKDELIKKYQESLALILPSINSNEAFGIVLIEALACGTPVIASNLPGVRTVFVDKISGLAIEPSNIEDLKDKLKYLLDNHNIRENMSQAARKLAELKYSEKIINSKITSIL